MSYQPKAFNGELSLDSLLSYLQEELAAIGREMSETTALDLRPVNRPPVRPRQGMIVYADGVLWNPGAGQGLYVFNGPLVTNWTKL